MKVGKRLSIEEMKNVQVGDKFFLAEESIGYTADVLYSEVEVTGIYDRRNNYDLRFNYKSPYETCSRVASNEDVRDGNCRMYHIEEEEEAKVEFENKPGWETTLESRPEVIGCPSQAPDSSVEEDVVNHPKHYTKHKSGIECIQITEHMGFNLGNAIKYLWRADEKGAPVEDLEKAMWYLQREIDKRKGEQA